MCWFTGLWGVVMGETAAGFFHDFRQDLLAGAESDRRFLLSEFMQSMAADLVETGIVEGFELCHFRAQRGMRVDGYWFDDEEGQIGRASCRERVEWAVWWQ